MMMFPAPPPSRLAGFTLIEMIVVIVLTGIIAGMVAVFIRSPIDAYVDTARRARLTADADTALRFFARDLRSALPNSLRVTAPDANGVQYLEFVPTTGGARYRQYMTAANMGNILDFGAADGVFDLIGPAPAFAAGQSVVIFNLEPGSVSDVYSGNNRAAVFNVAGPGFSSDASPIKVLIAATAFPSPSPAARAHFVSTPVTYECNPLTRQLRRYAGYAFAAAQPAPPAGASSVLVGNVAACALTYNPAVTSTRTGLVILGLTLTQAGESVRLVHQVHVQNMP